MCPARQQQTELCWQKKTSWKAPSILQIRQIQPLGTGSRRGYANPKASRFTYVHRTLGKDKYLLLRKIITIKILILEFLWSPFNLEVLTDLRNTDIKTLNQNSKWQARYTDIFLKKSNLFLKPFKPFSFHIDNTETNNRKLHCWKSQ